MPVTVLVPVKQLARAKSRLRSEWGPSTSELVLAMALDVVGAALLSAAVDRVEVVTSDPTVAARCALAGARIVGDPGQGLNEALALGSARARDSRPDTSVIAQPADCPCVAPGDFDVLVAALSLSRQPIFVPDAAGTGTASLAAPAGSELPAAYGPRSAAAHLARGAVRLEGPQWLRLGRDVDTVADLRAAAALGLGEHTRDWVLANQMPTVPAKARG